MSSADLLSALEGKCSETACSDSYFSIMANLSHLVQRAELNAREIELD